MKRVERWINAQMLIFPENDFYKAWDVFITVLLLFSCMITPVQIALYEELGKGWTTANWIIDLLFLFDIIVNFNAATYDDDFELISDRKTIMKNYFFGWFTIDLLSILPFELMISSKGEATNMVRLSRIGRLQKITKLLKLARLLKFAKSSSLELFDRILEYLQLSAAFTWLFLFVFGFCGVTHIVACFWIIIGLFDSEDLSWATTYEAKSRSDLYLTSFYWAITTITTVGYGDISASTFPEKIFSIIIMFTGVIGFSFVSGTLTNLILKTENENAILE